MTKKNSSLHLRISKESKKRLEDKAENLGLSITNYIEKVANEPIIFIDKNIRKFLNKINRVERGLKNES